MIMCTTIAVACILLAVSGPAQADNTQLPSFEDTLCNLCKKRDCSKVESMSDLQAKLDKHDKDIKDLQERRSTIAFFAYVGSNVHISTLFKQKTLIYDKVNMNIGNGYDKTTGLFTAPSEGTYVIKVSTGAFDGSSAVVELVQNGIVQDISFADSANHPDRTFVTSVTPLYLKKGDVVNARIAVGSGGNYIESNHYMRCSFYGFKLN